MVLVLILWSHWLLLAVQLPSHHRASRQLRPPSLPLCLASPQWQISFHHPHRFRPPLLPTVSRLALLSSLHRQRLSRQPLLPTLLPHRVSLQPPLRSRQPLPSPLWQPFNHNCNCTVPKNSNVFYDFDVCNDLNGSQPRRPSIRTQNSPQWLLSPLRVNPSLKLSSIPTDPSVPTSPRLPKTIFLEYPTPIQREKTPSFVTLLTLASAAGARA
jgi:hypothetical protein